MENPFFIDLEYIFTKVYQFVSGGDVESYFKTAWDYFYFWLRTVGWSVSLVLLIGVLVVRSKRNKLIEGEDAKYKKQEETDESEVVSPAREHWQTILGKLDSTNPNDWKAGILEADTILDELVKRMGYDGENLGERMKNIEKSDFTTLDDAWEAHKIRNRIAHGSSDFVLTQREAKRAIELFQKVFEEFQYI
ncbi:MAG: hypothetical protein AAB840_02330 [Patescibacteria group bacterium]